MQQYLWLLSSFHQWNGTYAKISFVNSYVHCVVMLTKVSQVSISSCGLKTQYRVGNTGFMLTSRSNYKRR